MRAFSRRKILQFFGLTAASSACKTVGSSLSGEGPASPYDYIIVGSGAGGGPLAVNLAKAGFRVLLLEAGGDPGNKGVYQVPAMHTQSTEDEDMAWDFFVDHFKDPAENQADSKYQPKEGGILYPRSGTLGGCTAHNAMILVAPLAKDWDTLADDIGDASYRSGTMRKYFQLFEHADYIPDSKRKLGWLPVNLANPVLIATDRAIHAMLLAAVRSMDTGLLRHLTRFQNVLGLVANPDSNAPTLDRDRTEKTIMIPISTTKKGSRYSTRERIKEQEGKNLTVKLDALVTRILFEESSVEAGEPKAIGIEYIIGKKIYKASKNPNPLPSTRHQVFANKEIILAAGTFNTPQILMQSGIGPKTELERFEDGEYKVILDRKGVGANLQDRYEVGVVSEARDPLAIVASCSFTPDSSDPCYRQWQKGTGPYTTNGGILGIMKKSKPSLESPDLFIFLLPTDFHGYFPGYSENIAKAKKSMTWCILKSHTHNRGGRITIRDLDPSSTPKINFHYYHDGTAPDGRSYNGNRKATVDDLEAVCNAVEFVRGIGEEANKVAAVIDKVDFIQGLLGRTGERYFNEMIPGNFIQSRDQLREWVRTHSWGHHACGTAKMGRKEDPLAVVDSKFRVIGTKGLRIVDASIFPRIPGYFIVSSIYTMSERASDEILADAGIKKRINP